MKPFRFAPLTFSVAFCCAYVAVFALNLPLFSYYPLHGQFAWGRGVLHSVGPAMAWYGLMTSATLIAGLVALCVPDRSIERVLRGYLGVFPVVAMASCAWLLRHFFA